MRIATNVNALNSWRNLSITNNSLSKTLEKLSSGYRINRAADDAAGLAISEKMRGQIAGLNMAVKNAQDSISLIQTAEGGLNEVHAMLKRMEELAVQSANDTNTADDRAKLQTEMDRLAEEVARIGSTTEFNTKALLNGKFNGVFHIGANENQNLRFSVADMRSFALGMAGDATASQNGTHTDVVDLGVAGASAAYSLTGSAGAWELRAGGTGGAVVANSTDKIDWTLAAAEGNDTFSLDLTAATSGDSGGLRVSGATIVVGSGGFGAVGSGASGDYTLVNDFADGTYTVAVSGSTYVLQDESGATVATGGTSGVTYTAVAGGDTLAFTPGVTAGEVTVSQSGTAVAAKRSLVNGGVVVGVGLEAGTYEIVGTELQDQNGTIIATHNGASGASAGYVDADGNLVLQTVDLAGISELVVGGIDISSQDAANKAITAIQAAVNEVSAQRSDLGALQNRLEHTINNLNVAAENLSAAESRIRDVDMAAEMANFTRNQILLQAGTAMLAQANAAPQTVLQLLG